MIKGRYVALIEIDLHIDDTLKDIRPFDDMSDDLKSGYVTERIRQMLIEDVFGEDFADVKVTQQYADLFLLKDGGDAE